MRGCWGQWLSGTKDEQKKQLPAGPWVSADVITAVRHNTTTHTLAGGTVHRMQPGFQCDEVAVAVVVLTSL